MSHSQKCDFSSINEVKTHNTVCWKGEDQGVGPGYDGLGLNRSIEAAEAYTPVCQDCAIRQQNICWSL